jgi:hypothetical protein
VVPRLPQFGTPCLLEEARQEVSSVLNDPTSQRRRWYLSSDQNGTSEIATELDDTFTGQEEFLLPNPVLRKIWKHGQLIARDELLPADNRYKLARYFYGQSCVIAVDYVDSDGQTPAYGWDPTCSGKMEMRYPPARIAVTPLIFLPFRY